MVLELAAAAEAKYLVTHNVKDFVGSETFGVTVVSPGEFLRVVQGDS
jgi:predicted nucleic acid-binding protein